MADKAHAKGMLTREIEKRTEVQASIQAISGLMQDGMTNTMSTVRHWEQDRNAGVQFGSYSPLPVDSSQPSDNFQSQDDFRYMYQQRQKEVQNVKQWRPFTDALAQLSKAKALSADTPQKHVPPPPSNAGWGPLLNSVILAAGDTMQFATGGEDPKAEAWVQSNAPKFDVKSGKVRQGAFFIIGGKPNAITRF